AASGLLFGVGNALLVIGLRLGSLAVVSVLVNLYPAFAVATAWLLSRQRLARAPLVGGVLAVAASPLLAVGWAGRGPPARGRAGAVTFGPHRAPRPEPASTGESGSPGRRRLWGLPPARYWEGPWTLIGRRRRTCERWPSRSYARRRTFRRI